MAVSDILNSSNPFHIYRCVITRSVNNEVENQNFVLKGKNFKLQMLQRVLELKDSNDRKMSIKFLIKAGLIEDENRVLENFIDSNSIPNWNEKEIGKLSSYLSSINAGSWIDSSLGSLDNTDSSGHRKTVRGADPIKAPEAKSSK